jgi:hypothetical protein
VCPWRQLCTTRARGQTQTELSSKLIKAHIQGYDKNTQSYDMRARVSFVHTYSCTQFSNFRADGMDFEARDCHNVAVHELEGCRSDRVARLTQEDPESMWQPHRSGLGQPRFRGTVGCPGWSASGELARGRTIVRLSSGSLAGVKEYDQPIVSARRATDSSGILRRSSIRCRPRIPGPKRSSFGVGKKL